MKKDKGGYKKSGFLKYLLILIVILIGAYFLFSSSFFTGKFILTETDYNSSGYSKPIDVFNGNKTIFNVSPDVNVLSNSVSQVFNVNVSHVGAYIYKRGYYWSQVDGKWVNFTFPQATAGNSNWINDFASTNVVVNVSKDFEAGENLFITYSCKKQGGVWKCGCNSVSEGACNRWMLQIVNVSKVAAPSCNENSECSSGFACVSGSCTQRAIGVGTFASPFNLYNCEDLQNVSSNLSASYVLANNIDCSGFDYGDGKGFLPIGNETAGFEFVGTLNGGGHVISNLYINRQINYVGLFAQIINGAKIDRVGIINANMSGLEYVGALVGLSASSVVNNSFSSGIIKGNAAAGGLAGGNLQGASIYNSYSIARVVGPGTVIYQGANYVGGLVGDCYKGRIYNSFAIGEVTGVRSGDLVGYSGTGTIIENSYVFFNDSNPRPCAMGNVGYVQDAWQLGCIKVNVTAYPDYFKKSYLEPMKSWNFTNIWAINSDVNGGYPYLI